VRVICDLLACVNIIKSTSTTRCRRQSVFDIERTNRLSLGRINHNPPSVLLRPIKRFWTSQLNEKKRTPSRFPGNLLFAPSIQTETLFSQNKFFSSFFFWVSRNTSHIWASSALALFLGSLHLNIYVRCACKKRKRRLGIECAHVEGQTVVQSLKRVVRGKRECLLWDS
jgi:hypothetical protein